MRGVGPLSKNYSFGLGLLIGGLVLLALVSGYNHFQTSDKGRTSIPNQPTGSGKIAPDFTLTDLAGQSVKLSDFKGKIVVLNFWASWCPPCKAEMPDLEQIAQDFRSSPDRILLAVNLTDGTREKESDARNYVTNNHFSMRVLLDHKGQIADDYGITGIPATFIIDRQGNIYQTIKGSTNRATILGYIDQLR